MNREDIIRMAREAGINVTEGNSFSDDMYISVLYRFANIVAAAEREACAQICDEQMEWGEINKSMAVAAGNCADLIRERGEQ